MIQCQVCNSQLEVDATKCPSCGSATDATHSPTLIKSDGREPGSSELGRLLQPAGAFYAPALQTDEARFAPGVVVAQRYRIRALLGRGGMGEVYRADDLKLHHAVALKFLPDLLARDGAALARFHREARVARQVSHPSVCRVFDIGEVDGQHFISMEYIDGEDLSSLLRRIGRLPSDKALQIARQLCAGLAAAHENGILHRDLKPANIMLDGKGKARITDFGLSSVAEEIASDELRAGTPAYMAPEQISGLEVSPRSDIYSLGLVLYELFTGRRAVDGPTLDSIIDQQVNRMPSTPSSVLREIDLRVEKAIMRCLEKDPGKRFASALDLAAALPGGDPLADALAAGETPSPEMVANARIEGTLKPFAAASLLSAVILGLVISVALTERGTLYRMVPLDKSPEVLADRARTILRKLGHDDSLSNTTSGLSINTAYVEYLRQNDPSPSRFDKLKSGRPAVMSFWYRGSRQPFVPKDYWNVGPDDPPFERPGMTAIWLDSLGRLIEFRGVPDAPSRDEAAASGPDWAPLFGEAGLDFSRFAPTLPEGAPQVAADRRFAWDGTYTERPDLAVRVQASSLGGRPLLFQVQNPWLDAGHSSGVQSGTIAANIYRDTQYSLVVMALIGSLLIAWRNLKLGRGDRRGAFRLFAFTFLISLAMWLLSADVFPTSPYVDWFVPHAWSRPLGLALVSATVIWLQYIALEPFLRQRWPGRIVAWSRLLSGAFRDPLVGRDILIGAAFGVVRLVSVYLSAVVPAWLGRGVDPILYPRLDGRMRLALGLVLERQLSAITLGLQYGFLLLLLFMLLRKQWAAMLVLGIFIVLSGSSRVVESLTWVTAAYLVLQAGLAVFVLWRYGVLALIAFGIFGYASSYPFTSDLSAWYAPSSELALAFLLAVAAYGFYTSLGGRPLFKADPLRI